MEELGKLSLSQDEGGEDNRADAHKGEVTSADGISKMQVIDQEAPLPKIRLIGAKGKQAKKAEKRRQRLAASIQQQAEAEASGGVEKDVLIVGDDLDSSEHLTTSVDDSDEEDETAEEAAEGGDLQKEENMEE
ncbi:MAG: hypothetical protein GY820_28080 [Gammaproteobacteria bacterium]|nr:hypothetical protein [Gammaproteobacteria bacterium]